MLDEGLRRKEDVVARGACLRHLLIGLDFAGGEYSFSVMTRVDVTFEKVVRRERQDAMGT